MSNLTIVLGNQLFDYKYYKNLSNNVFMCEDVQLCTHFKYHKHKIIHFLASMREYADYLKEKGKNVKYIKFEKKSHFFSKLQVHIDKLKVKQIEIYEIEDKFFEEKLMMFFKKSNLKVKYLKSPMFICSRDQFKDYLVGWKKPLMNSFYIAERKRNNILLDNDKPVGGKWSFDNENRKKIPKKFEVDLFEPPLRKNKYIETVKKLVDNNFSSHPGETDNFWIPTNRKDSIKWFKEYLKKRFIYFGDYQDAIDTRAPFLYHSVISPMVNIGFITPNEVIKEVLTYQTPKNLNSVEGFIRQVMGWREFVRGIYQNFDHIQQKENFFNHNRKLKKCWYKGETGIPPLDDAIKKAQKWGYCHHIERLMVIGNIMLLLNVHPLEVYKWFMEMFVDSSDWVMGPNVFGMSQFSDGGIFATKPYISGSNYLLKMSHYKKEPWCDAIDGLYWQFIEDNKAFFKKNHRMSMMVKNLEKMPQDKKDRIYKAAVAFKKEVTSL